jgi:hypothetical protein
MSEETELQRMLLIPPDVWEKKCKQAISSAPPPPSVKKILNSKDHSYNKWTKVRMQQDPYLIAEKRKREPIVKREVPVLDNDVKPKREIQLNSAFGVYRDTTDGSFKIGSSKFNYNDTHVFVDDDRFKATEGLWELLTKSKPNKSMVTPLDLEAYKQILLQSNAHRANYSPRGKIRANRGLKYTQFIARMFRPVTWTSFK